MNKAIIASTIGIALLGTGTAHGANVGVLPGYGPMTSSSSNFTVLNPGGGMVGGTNDVVINWDGTAFNASSDYTGPGSASNMAISSPTPFFSYPWTAHDIQVFAPGSYTFDTTLGGGNPEIGIMAMNVGAGQIGMHMLYDWNGNLNMDIAMIWTPNAVFGSGTGNSANATFCSAPASNCLWDGLTYGPTGQPAGNKIWALTSADGNGDGIPGIPTAVGGPTAGFNYSFNIQPVPLPSAIWLLGSGLLGLLGMTRKRKSA